MPAKVQIVFVRAYSRFFRLAEQHCRSSILHHCHSSSGSSLLLRSLAAPLRTHHAHHSALFHMKYVNMSLWRFVQTRQCSTETKSWTSIFVSHCEVSTKNMKSMLCYAGWVAESTSHVNSDTNVMVTLRAWSIVSKDPTLNLYSHSGWTHSSS